MEDISVTRIMPNSLEAEQSVIGSMIMDRQAIITAYEDKLYISARSIDEVNVQLVMEKLGGGGHMSIAGAQLTDCTIEQAVNTIKLTLDKMLEDGEI